MSGRTAMAGFQPRDPDFRARLQRYVAAQDYLGLIGVELTRIEPGVVEYRVPFRRDLGQQNGYFHGGVVGSLAEAVMGAAAATLVDAERNVVGADYTVHLLAPALAPAVVARGRVVKSGRSLFVCRADVVAGPAEGPERLCAVAQGAMAVVPA